MIKRPLVLLAPDSPAVAAPPAPKPSTAAPTPPPPSPESLTGDSLNAFNDIDAQFQKSGAVEDPPPAKPAPKPASGEPKPAPAAAVPPSPKLEPKPADAVKPTTEPQRTPKELRGELDRVKAEFHAHKATTATLEAKIKDYEKKGYDVTAMTARLEARDKDFEKLQGELRALKQEASPEFKAKYDVPFNRAAKYSENLIKGVTRADGQAADFDKDFVPLYRMPLNAAWQRAKELFGEEAAPAIMQQVGKLQELDFERREAFEEEKRGWAEKAKADEGLAIQNREKWNDAVKSVRTELPNTPENPLYRDPADDNELSALRQQGYQIFDAEPKTPKEKLWKEEHQRQRVAAFGPMQLLLKRRDARIVELEAELEKHKPRQPNPNPARPGAGDTPPVVDPENQAEWAKGLREQAESAA